MFRAYYPALVAFATRLVDELSIAEELVQSTFLNIWQARDRFIVRHSVRAYLFGAVRNQAANHLERRRTALRFERAARATGETAPQPPPTQLEALEADELADRVRRALDTLPPRCREVMLLRWMHQLRHAEIADALGISTKAVERNISRGLDHLRTRFGVDGP